MSQALQVKLLRVLQEKEIKPIGSNTSIKINTSVLTATNRKLEEEANLKNFREDLFFRISIFLIDLPPLRERIDDIPVLTEYLLDQLKKRYSKQIKSPSKDLMYRLKNYRWPGNIRELQNCLEQLSFEKKYIQDILTVTEGKITKASNIAGRFRSDLYRLID